ncbi:Helix-turn-helix domain [Mannheimia haemolytica]|uniref:Helix-turn-helix domain n=1 Tax=Mannheimia haemolytica TaxID=75985 RepID=A0A3S4YIA6_MANHA|nr:MULTISPECIES: helix-turn-helix transcriptional regulator [Pasteurellaceae]ATW44088.1 transcriptional regulator [Glaesserella parasuis D74]EQA11000.1 helix-turn-helix family protein [Glaesserella parasuis D74]MDP0318401.1 helix-turn-helix transcriptional regulator [Glaesserella parasuis]VEI77984.1 Helix-turn-helix domain [Mannheimia haemolytica]
MSIRERLRIVIEIQGISIKAFAELVDIPLRTLHNYLSGEREPSSEFLSKIADKFNINLNWLLLSKGKMYLEENKIDLDEDESELLDHYRSVNELGKRILKKTSKIILSELSNNEI